MPEQFISETNKKDATGSPWRCLVCGESANIAPPGYPGLVQCENCSFLTADVSLTTDAITALYGHDYFHGEEYLDYEQDAPSLRHNFRARLQDISQHFPGFADRSLFEIGCAYGFFLDEARRRFASAAGIDISADAVAYARDQLGVDARCGDYLALELDRPVDVICMWDVIEHLPRPDLFMKKAAMDLVAGGALCITTGDVGSLNARFRKGKWRMVHPPTHLHYFSVATLTRLLERAGFEVASVSHPGISRSVSMMMYRVLTHGLGQPALYRLFEKLPIADAQVSLNLFDIMHVIARKRAD